MNARLKTLSFLIAAALSAGAAFAHDPAEQADANQEIGEEVPLYDNLGDLSYPISTASETAQRYFNQGLRLTYAFNHAEALRAYRAAQRHDPECAMCYWGEAFALGPNINAPMDDSAANPALDAIRRAQELAHHAKPNEQALIAALATRYSDPSADRAALDQAYAEAMAEVAQRFPDDQEIAVFYIDSIMNTSPWDYWEADGETPKGRIGEAIAAAEKVLAANPDHPGAIHLYIHLTEASTTPERAEPYADRLPTLMPGAGHLVHMASHTYFRIGRYHDSAAVNKEAVKADEAYLAEAGGEGIYRYGYYPHNIHFTLVSAQMTGDHATTLEYAHRLEGKIPDEIAEQVGWIQAIRTAPYYAHAQFSGAQAVRELPDPGDKFPLIKAMWRYARGVAYAEQGELEAARNEAAKIAELKQNSDFGMLLAWAVPAPDLLDLARHVVEARIAQAENDLARAIREYRVAVAIQDSLAYMEPPYWYYPVRQSLGAALLQAGRAEEAEQAFARSLHDFPNNGLALYGLMQAQKAQGKQTEAGETEQRFRQAWAGDPEKIDLRRL